MSDTVERIINLILEDMTKTRSCENSKNRTQSYTMQFL